jgi:DNA-binding MarR family transcriptional regulator
MNMTHTNDNAGQIAGDETSLPLIRPDRQPVQEDDVPGDLDRRAQRMLAEMEARLEVFVGLDHLFGDPAWSILLFLYRKGSQQVPATLTDVTSASGAPASTAVRYLERLERAGLLKREADWRNRRRYHVALSPRGRQLMDGYLAGVVTTG